MGKPRTPAHRMRRWVAAGFLLIVLVTGVPFVIEYGFAGPPKDCAVHASPQAGGSLTAASAVRYPGRLAQEGGTVNDASCLSRTAVYGVVRPRSEGEVREALEFAAEQDLTVSIAGTRHAMGGQAMHPGALLLDMRDMAQVEYDASAEIVRVGAGAPWSTVLEHLHDEGRSVAAMPSIDILSVGGTVSVNAHGADFRVGSLASTVRSLTLVTADGRVKQLSRERDPDLFRAVIGGYGLFGVITEVELETVANEIYALEQRVVRTADVADAYADVAADDANVLMYGHLSTSPGSFLDEVILYTYALTGTDEKVPPLDHAQDSRFARLVFNTARHGGLAQRTKWTLQKHLLPHLRPCAESRNSALRAAEACLVSRSQAMYNDLGILENRLGRFTDVLHEYFLAPDELAAFLADARPILRAHDAQALSASIRSVHTGEVLLNYAPDDRLSVVLYLSQRTDKNGVRDMKSLTQKLVALALEHGGTFYLPYQQYYSGDQVRAAYPALDEFFALKRKVDADERFVNSLYTRFG